MMCHVVQGTGILERRGINILAVLSEYDKHGRYNGLNEILVLRLLW